MFAKMRFSFQYPKHKHTVAHIHIYMHIQIHTVVPALKRFGLVKCDTVWRFSQSCTYNAETTTWKRHCGERERKERWPCRAGRARMCACFCKTRVLQSFSPIFSHHASSSERSSLLSLARSRCRWMARQMRQRTPPLRERRIDHDRSMYEGVKFFCAVKERKTYFSCSWRLI